MLYNINVNKVLTILKIKGGKEMNDVNRKWYVVSQRAEGCTRGIISLTDEELTAAKRLLNYDVVVEDTWSGGFGITDGPFDTEEEARIAAING